MAKLLKLVYMPQNTGAPWLAHLRANHQVIWSFVDRVLDARKKQLNGTPYQHLLFCECFLILWRRQAVGELDGR